MNASDGSGVLLVLVFVALALFTVFLVFKSKTKGFFGNRYLLIGVVAGLLVFFLLARGTMVSYYKSIFKEVPYDFSELKSIVFKYGVKDSLVNEYNSATGAYRYLNTSDSLVKTTVYLTATDLLYLHRKAAELGFWDFPVNEVNSDTTNTNGVKQQEYLIEFNYQHKSKSVVFSSNYDGPQQLVDANRLLIQEIQGVLANAEARQKK